MPRKPGDLPESPHKSANFRKFKTVNTQPSRTALKENEFAWLENFMPIGDANLPVIPAVGTIFATITDSTTSTVTTTDTGGPGGLLVTRYVGVAHGSTTFSANTFISEWGLWNDGGRITASMSYVGASIDFGTFARMIDGSLADLNGWISTKTLIPDTNQVAGIDFTVSRTVLSMAFASGGTSSDPPSNNHVYYQTNLIRSDDNFSWVFVQLMTGLAPSAEQAWGNTWTISTLPLPGARRYWRLIDWKPNPVSHDVIITEAQLYNGATQKTSEAVVTTNFTFSAGVLSNIYDNNLTSLVQISYANVSSSHYFMYDFTTPTVIDGVRIGVGGDSQFTPYQVTMEYSDDNSTWSFAGRIEVFRHPGNNTWGQVAVMFR